MSSPQASSNGFGTAGAIALIAFLAVAGCGTSLPNDCAGVQAKYEALLQEARRSQREVSEGIRSIDDAKAREQSWNEELRQLQSKGQELGCQ